MKFNQIICDLSNLFFRNYFVFKDMVINIDNTEIFVGGIFGCLKSINKIEKEYLAENGSIYYLSDNFASRDNIRKEIDPDYKLNRKKYSDNFYRSLDYLLLILLNHSNNYYSIKVDGLEADDLVPSLLTSFKKRDNILICSEDLDYARNIDDNIYWYSHNQVYDKELFKQKYKFIPTKQKICLYKVFRGDASDNIPIGIKGIPEKIILQLLEENFEDIYDLLNKIHSLNYLGKWKDEIIKRKARLILNYQLVDFINISYNELKNFIRKGMYNPSTLRSLYKLLNLKVSEVDQRLMSVVPTKEEINNSNFFDFQKIKRV
jgi:5'-3' exonuclease